MKKNYSLLVAVLHGRAALVAAFLIGSLAAQALTVTKGNTYTRPSGATYPDPLSGITYAGGNSYYAVADNGADVWGLYPCSFQVSSDGKTISSFQIATTNNAVKPSGTSDVEGIAYDPATGNIWIADESKKTIKEYNPTTGAVIQSLTIPSVMTKNRSNYGFESLTISGDGLTLWTCNEEALTCDGDRSSYTSTTTVRLCKYTRATVKDNFTLAAMYPYTTEKWTYQYDYSSKARCGVADLCALPDGSLLVLERELSFSSNNALAIAFGSNLLGWKLYHVADPSSATDVQSYTALSNTIWAAVSKSQLASGSNSLLNYGNFEGICLGPRLSDTTVSLLLISDSGDGYSKRQILPLVLSGLNVRTLAFETPARGTASITGSNYRFLNGAPVNVALDGAQSPATAYTNNAAALTSVSWTAAGQSPAAGSGETASFNVAADGTFTWAFADIVASTPIIGSDSFEAYALGTDASGLAGWSGAGTVEAGTPTAPANGYPMPNETHAKVLAVDDGLTRTYTGTTNGNQRLEMMVSVRRSADDELDVPEGDNQVVVAADKDGYLNVYRRTASGNACEWARLSETQYANGQWVRVSLYMDYDNANGASVLVKLDGVDCGWHLMVNGGTSGKVSSFTLTGDCKVDDVMLTMTHYDGDWPSAGGDTVPPAAWFDSYGITGESRNPSALAANGYTMLESYDAGLDPTSVTPFLITSIQILADGKLQLTINGMRPDLNDTERTVLYRVFGMTTVGGTESEIAGTATSGTSGTVWTSTAPVSDEKAFYKVKVVPNR